MPQTNLTKARENAKKIGVTVKPSTVKNKKLDVFNKDNKKIASIGDKRYDDYLTTNDDKKKANYKKRHEKNRKVVNTPGYYADKILWT